MLKTIFTKRYRNYNIYVYLYVNSWEDIFETNDKFYKMEQHYIVCHITLAGLVNLLSKKVILVVNLT
jgi:hypothetical protein